jgi:acyl carrier protein
VTNEQIKDVVVRVLTRIAPEARGQVLASTVSLRDQLDLDSMDVLNFAIGLHDELHVEIPEVDYSKLTTLDGAVSYLAGRLMAGRGA